MAKIKYGCYKCNQTLEKMHKVKINKVGDKVWFCGMHYTEKHINVAKAKEA